MPEPLFAELLDSCTRNALKLELRDQYMTDDPGYLAWQSGDVDQAVRKYAEWTETARSAWVLDGLIRGDGIEGWIESLGQRSDDTVAALREVGATSPGCAP